MIIDFKKYSSVRIGSVFEVELLDSVAEFDGFLIGGANNLLISDTPKKMGILSDKFDFIKILDKNTEFITLQIGCATKSSTMYQFAKQHNLKGFEFLTKIPGKLGGLLKMNAGLKDCNISTNLSKIMTAKGEIKREDIAFSYRFCPLNMPFFWAEFKLNYGFDTEKDVALKLARNNQPSGASFGSIFKNPSGDFAGRLIESVGLKGFSKNDAKLSEKHANFLINKKNATFDDAIFLIELARKRVFEEFGIKLENEVIIL
ncbi:UDP-N-acetylmuramate dehydrogenase [Campylobacter helveticus]|uniref:UDP-N-acetylenolpyruvoylglucosamine reductase n=1 Tax=Campylobacter helveticus TaxID=28898 RepID=A0AAX2UJC4_9BACT|nr:UDP-N-acetylmuramate dehydrogenase [Campylobacter helveticus]MCR2054533.1 UDP-N-acetylmuramate dehydrogenase [Campylobacter helveticus]MCR2059605.1 UDP-N-acetylmuramate dehydrogenase [Campylobacter helveticus]MCR2061505.1 UDP-N-acetylmuramate dehydrogenase [Campylobacter helveticus]MCR2065996.1 UDP-N-acetylmuramate dehydrogenase [Campylobacter helveticus]TNB55585.1 UDP-N-acetylmuramate dehydrogenase [Campylobacter helveticus]